MILIQHVVIIYEVILRILKHTQNNKQLTTGSYLSAYTQGSHDNCNIKYLVVCTEVG